ncbi:MAG TPA: 1-deoxy-D-xylulose-5-phosphate reductoisomerase, partial [Candidatus Polarisedimenticolia bacterium]|nr:1-deoxy-D-xylulose-5-phosphate reductoisomerase [Candidatus Polarisedimenticolia bacterium]
MPDTISVAILGSTGSVGAQALDLIARFPDRFQVTALASGSRHEAFIEQVKRFRPRVAALAREDLLAPLKAACEPLGVEALVGEEGLLRVATHPDADRVVSAIVGAAGLGPTLAALQARKTVALANKESLVIAGELMLREAERNNALLLPVDSEHSALHQCLRGERREEVRRLILTASGGPFRQSSLEEMEAALPEQALRHPTWEMGPKITIDSATLMNKGLE